MMCFYFAILAAFIGPLFGMFLWAWLDKQNDPDRSEDRFPDEN